MELRPNKVLELTAAYVAFFERSENSYWGEGMCCIMWAAAQLERWHGCGRSRINALDG